MIVNSFPTVSEKFLINQVTGLIDKNIDVTIYAAVKSEDMIIHSLYTSYKLSEITRQLDIPTTFEKRLLRFPKVFVRNFFRHPLFTLRALSVKKYKRPAKNLKALFFLDAMYNQHYDVVHCQFGINGFIGAFLKDCNIANRLVVTFHGSDITVFPKNEGFDVYRYMFSRADAITAGTSFTKRLLIEHNCPEKKIHVIPAGIRIDNYPNIDFDSNDKKIILSVGRLEEVKGFEYSIKAFALIAQNFPNLTYIIAGDGSYRNSLQNQINTAHLETRIILVGLKSDDEITDLYNKSLLLLAPSIRASNGSEEGQGLVIQEAEMAGLPVIGTLTGGIPDGIIDGKTGFLVPEKDPEAIADKISQIASDNDLRKRMGLEGRNLINRNYSISFLTDELISCFNC